jgi:hypothetical protein
MTRRVGRSDEGSSAKSSPEMVKDSRYDKLDGRSFDCASRDETARGSAQDDDSQLLSDPVTILSSCPDLVFDLT